MKAKFINEYYFERHKEPKAAMQTGLAEKWPEVDLFKECYKYCKELEKNNFFEGVNTITWDIDEPQFTAYVRRRGPDVKKFCFYLTSLEGVNCVKTYYDIAGEMRDVDIKIDSLTDIQMMFMYASKNNK